jgi:hypothetical protein
MRFGLVVTAACVFILPAIAGAQTYPGSGGVSRSPGSVIRPAPTAGWRNYVSVPDGPCGYPMSVEADCYNSCRPCGPLHPVCFIRRVGRMLDCLLPCNMCCRGGGGGGLFHGCLLGGRTWGHCSVCCGGGGACGGGGCGGCGGGAWVGGGCGGNDGCPNPCGSAFAPCCSTPSCTTGGHCHGCSSALPGLSDPFQDDPLPPTPTAQPAEVRQSVMKKSQTAAARPQTKPATSPRTSPYKIVGAPATVAYVPRSGSRAETTGMATGSHTRKATGESVLRRASAEQETAEPGQFQIDYGRTAPIVRSQSPDDAADYAIPHNPLR